MQVDFLLPNIYFIPYKLSILYGYFVWWLQDPIYITYRNNRNLKLLIDYLIEGMVLKQLAK